MGAESKDPEDVSFAVPPQGVLKRTSFAHIAGLETLLLNRLSTLVAKRVAYAGIGQTTHER
jgi:hypothetical protein